MDYAYLKDHCTITSSKRIFAEQYVDEGIPFYRSKEIIEKNNGEEISEPLFISRDAYEKVKNKFGIPKEGDILLTSVGSIGIPYIVKKETFYFKDGNLTWMKNFKKSLSSKYLYYWISSDFGKKMLINRCIGSSQSALTIDTIKKYKLPIPERNIQDKIVNILENYDALIETNNKKIKILEQMAEIVYHHLFSASKLLNCKTIRLKEIINYSRGLSYSSEDIDCEEGINLINLKNLQSYGGFRRDGTKKYSGKYKAEQLVNQGDLVMGITDVTQDRRTVGYIAIMPQLNLLNVISADLIKINSKYNKYFLYSMFTFGGLSKYISQFANGTNVLHLRPETIMNIKFIMPNDDLIEKYVEIAEPIFKNIDLLNEQNDNLTKQRDLLLPRLMSGKLEVK